MSDLISRQDAINAIQKDMNDLMGTYNTLYGDGVISGMTVATMILRDIPSADRGTGEWIRNEGTVLARYTCSECGTYAICKEDFCHGCGADMRGGKR